MEPRDAFRKRVVFRDIARIRQMTRVTSKSLCRVSVDFPNTSVYNQATGGKSDVGQQPSDPLLSAVQPLDVLIITAAAGEDDAVRMVDEGAFGAWEQTPGPPGFGFTVWRRSYQAVDGGQLTVALCRAYEAGGEAAGNAAARLVDAYRPRCLAMCGVCAGNPRVAQLGDVIIADRVYPSDVGEIVRTPGDDQPCFLADMMTYPFDATWKQAAENLSLAVFASASWLAERPRPREMQGDWVLKQLLDGCDPRDAKERGERCFDWKDVVPQLQQDGFIALKDGQPELTQQGRDRIKRVLFDNRDGQLPEQPPWGIRVGPLGTGNDLVRDATIWERLGQSQRHIVGLDMEGAVIGFTAHVRNLRYIVVKGVMDYADPGRSQGFRKFAARAAAEVLLEFLRRNLAPLVHGTAATTLKPNTAPHPGAARPGDLAERALSVRPVLRRTPGEGTRVSGRLVRRRQANKRECADWPRRFRQDTPDDRVGETAARAATTLACRVPTGP